MVYPIKFKVKITDRIRPVARILLGPITKEYTDAMKKDEWLKVKKYCDQIGAPGITSAADIKKKWSQWKQTLAQKIERKSKTGAAGEEDFNEAELTINAIIKENTCLQKTEVCAR